MISQNRNCDITKSSSFFLISQNNPEFFYITNSIFLYHKFDFVISKNQDDFFISKKRFCDITKYEVFSTDEMMTPIKKSYALNPLIGGRHCLCSFKKRMCFNYLRELSFFQRTEM